MSLCVRVCGGVEKGGRSARLPRSRNHPAPGQSQRWSLLVQQLALQQPPTPTRSSTHASPVSTWRSALSCFLDKSASAGAWLAAACTARGAWKLSSPRWRLAGRRAFPKKEVAMLPVGLPMGAGAAGAGRPVEARTGCLRDAAVGPTPVHHSRSRAEAHCKS